MPIQIETKSLVMPKQTPCIKSMGNDPITSISLNINAALTPLIPYFGCLLLHSAEVITVFSCVLSSELDWFMYR